MTKNLLLLAFFLSSICAVAQSPDVRSKSQIIVGSGGGVVGKETAYVFLESGYLYQQLPNDSLVKARILYKSTAKKYFDWAKKLKLSKRDFNHPGNIYAFVKFHESQKNEYGVTWGEAKMTPPKDVKAFYDAFMKLVPKK